ncbi:MAG: ABC transporter substrate-binding protein [Desulforhabdus sp.]|jgi:phospholipid transport system substrate-binding protein|nr:ABC transporter substrate-binding protein [Desulforhabdus sp.]
MPSIHSSIKSRLTAVALKTSMLTFALTLFFCVSIYQAGAGSGPLETVQTGTEKVLTILKQQTGNEQKRRAEIRTVVDQYFDFEEMAKRALGPEWNNQPAARQQDYVRAFSEFLFSVYIDKIEKYTDEKITYQPKEEEGDRAVVNALVEGSKTGKIGLEYRLHSRAGSWKAWLITTEVNSVQY